MRDGRTRPGAPSFDLSDLDPFGVAVEQTERGVRVHATAPRPPEPKRATGPQGPFWKPRE